MIFPSNQSDQQQFVDGLIDIDIDNEQELFQQDYEQLLTKLRLTIDTNYSQKKVLK